MRLTAGMTSSNRACVAKRTQCTPRIVLAKKYPRMRELVIVVHERCTHATDGRNCAENDIINKNFVDTFNKESEIVEKTCWPT